MTQELTLDNTDPLHGSCYQCTDAGNNTAVATLNCNNCTID